MKEKCEEYIKTLEKNRRYIRDHYRPLYKSLYILNDDIFAPSFVKAIRTNTPVALMQILKQEHPGIYSFDMLQPDFCNQLLEEVLSIESWCKKNKIDQQRPNSMNNYGMILDDLGFASFLDQLMTEYIIPLSTLLFKDVGGDSLDEHHGFIVEYKLGKDISLGFHTDGSEVTLNVCLGKKFAGGTLYYKGLRCRLCQQTQSLPQEEVEINHMVGRAILNRGQHRHGANDITSGERYNLILGCKSKHYRQQYNSSKCPSWCDWHTYMS